MRLGLYEAVLKNNSLISKIYSMKKISSIISLIKDCDLKTKGVGGSNSSEKDILRQLLVEIMN